MPDQEADEYVVSDPELITRVRTGDREAFGELYKRHSGAATTLSRQFARSATESDDLVSESFARVLDNLLAGKGPDTAFRAYLFTTIRNTAYDRTRKDKRLQFTDDMTTHDSAVVGDDPVLAKMESGLVATAFAQLPERWQAVLWHTQVEGETPAQVGALLGMAPGAVSSLAFRAREGLREAYLQAHLAETAAEQCRTTVERLGAWTRGGLSKREKAQVDAHLETCERCRALAAELEEVNHGLRGLLAPLLLGGAAAGYLATLGPVAPLAAPGTLIAGAGAGGSGAAGSGSAGSGAGGSGAGGSGGAGAAGGGAGAAGGATAGSAAATAAGVAAAAAAVAAGAIGVAALASAGSSGATAAAAGTGAAAAGASGGGAVGAAAAGASGGGAVGAGGGTAGGAGASAGAGTAAGAGAAAGGGTVFAGLGVGGLVAAGAALVVAAVAAVVFVVSGNSPDTTNTAGQDVAISDVAPASDTGAANDPGAAGGISLADPGATDGTAGTAASVPIVPGADPATTGATDGAVVPVVATTTQSTPTAGDVTDSPTADSSATGPGSQPNTVNPTPTNPVTPPEPTNPTTTDPTTTDPTTTDPTTTTPPPPVADLVVTFPTVAPPLNAGATGTVSLTLTNNGDGASTIQSADLVLPEGVQVTGVDSTDPVPALRRATMGLLRAGPCLSAPSTTCTIDLPAVPAHHKVTVTLTLAVDSTVTGGDLTITVLGKPFTITLQVNSPAALSLGQLDVTQDLYAGGTGQLSVRVSNTGQQSSVDQSIDVNQLPDGVTVSGITGDGVSCEAEPPANALAVDISTCILQPVNPDDSALVVIDLDVEPWAPSSTETPTTVTIGDNPDGASRSLTVQRGILSLDTTPAGPFTAGQPATLTVTPELQETVTDAGSITVSSTDDAVTFRPSSGCSPIAGENAVSCASTGFDLAIAIAVDHAAGPLLLTATDAGGRDLEFPAFQIEAAAPANLEVTGLTTSRILIAGGTGELTVQVTNSGDLPSADELIDVDLPTGITVTEITSLSVTDDDRSLCTPAVPDQNLLAAAAAEPVCTLPALPARADVTLLIELAVAPSAGKEPAEATVTIGTGTTNSSTTTLNVRAGITGLDTSPAGPFTAGRPLQLTVTPQAPEGVTAGAVTLVSDDPTVTFGRTPDCEPVTGANAVTCQRDPQVTPTLPFTVPVNIPVTHPAGELAITAADEGDRPLRFTAAPLMIAAAAPANLVVTDLAVSEKLIAGGTGQLTVKVQNIGALAAAEQAIDVALPDGITATSVVAGDTTLCAVDNGRLSCELPPLDAGESRTLVIALAVPSTTIDEPGTATVTIGDGPDASDSVELTVASGISALRTKASNPLYTGTTTTMQIDVESRVEEPGPITFIATSTGVTFGKSAGCDAPSGTSTIVCDGDTIGLSITISPDQAPGTLPVTVLDNGDRKLALKDAAGQDFRIERAKSSLQIDKLSISTPLLAGGTGGVTVQVSNTGGQRSEKGPIEIDLPDGVELSGMTYGESSLCTAVRDAAPTCTLPEIDPGKPINVVIDLIVQPDAKSDPGNAKVVIAGDTESVPLAVEAGISALVADEGGPLTAGTTVKLTVSADLLDGVTEAGRVTLTAADGVFFGESSGCSPAKGGSTIDCDSSGFTAAVSIPANHPVGTLSVKAVDAGQRTVALLDAARKPFEVVAAPKQLDVSDLEVEQLPNLSGTITLKVSNPADAPSAPMPVDIVLPKGFTTEAVVSVFEPKFRLTVCTNPPCTLEPVDSRGSATLYVGFTAREGATTGPAIVTIDGVTKEAQVIGGGLIVDLLKPKTETAPTDIAQPAPLIGGQSDQSLPIPPTLTPDGAAPQADTPGAGGVVENDPPTGDATPTGTAPTSAGEPSAGATNPSSPAPTTPSAAAGPAATDTSITDTVTMDETTRADPTTPAPSTEDITPSSIEDTTPAPATTSDAPITQPAAPAAVALTRPGGAETLTAGGTGTLRFSATNSGGERSGPTAFDIDLPAGVIVRSVSINGSTICESRSCQLPGIEPGASITVEVDIAAAVDAATGGASATIDGSGVGWTVAVEPVTGPGTGDTLTAVLPTAVMPGLDDLVPAGN